MNLYDAEKEEKLRLLQEWKEATQKDIDGYQTLVNKQLDKKRVIEERASLKLRPLLKNISVFQRFVDSFINKRNKIDEEIKKLQSEQ